MQYGVPQAIELALEHHRAGRLAQAEALYRQVLQAKPAHADALHLLGLVAYQSGDSESAAALIERAVGLKPGKSLYLNSLGEANRALGRIDEALKCYARAVEVNPAHAEAHNNLCVVLRDLGRLEEAERSGRLALAARPSFGVAAVANNSLANVFIDFGRLQEAEQSLRRALQLNAGYAEAHSNLIFTLDLMDQVPVEEQQAERRRWNERHARLHSAAIIAHANSREAGRRLRVGYVSADFRRHSASYLFAPVLLSHDRSLFEVACYSGNRREDEVTERLRGAAALWRSTPAMSDEALAGQIRADGIDILVDLSGHSAGNRLLVFARKPAPLQVTAWGHATGTGLASMDCFFADPVLVPQAERGLYAEEVVDLPCCVCYEPPQYLPQVAELPALSGKPFTFGCFNRVQKISGRVIGLWARILAALPGSRLLLKCRELGETQLQEELLRRLESSGVDRGRVRLAGYSTHAEHLGAYHEVDLALDPYPHGGGASTLEALWMGVPVVTLRGNTPASRNGAALYTALQMPQWIAASDEEYVRIAQSAAGDLAQLAGVRSTLRERCALSVIGDTQRYTRAVEAAFRALWGRWCSRAPA